MNITDIKDELRFDGDKLDLIFEFQRRLKEKYNVIERKKGNYVPDLPLNIDGCRDQEYLRSLIYRVISELVEAGECLKNKMWKQSEVITDVDHLKEEISDAVHFLIELCICLSIDSEEFFKIYFKKMKVNEWRISTNY